MREDGTGLVEGGPRVGAQLSCRPLSGTAGARLGHGWGTASAGPLSVAERELAGRGTWVSPPRPEAAGPWH